MNGGRGAENAAAALITTKGSFVMRVIPVPNPADAWKPRRREIPLDPQLAATWAEWHEAIEIVRPRCRGFSDDMIYRYMGDPRRKVRIWNAPCGIYPRVAVYLRADLETFSLLSPVASPSAPDTTEKPPPAAKRATGPIQGHRVDQETWEEWTEDLLRTEEFRHRKRVDPLEIAERLVQLHPAPAGVRNYKPDTIRKKIGDPIKSFNKNRPVHPR